MLVYEESRKISGEKPLEARERTNNKQAATKHIVSLRNMPTYIVSPKDILNESVGKRFELKKKKLDITIPSTFLTVKCFLSLNVARCLK